LSDNTYLAFEYAKGDLLMHWQRYPRTFEEEVGYPGSCRAAD
jgi:hypothetical protein